MLKRLKEMFYFIVIGTGHAGTSFQEQSALPQAHMTHQQISEKKNE